MNKLSLFIVVALATAAISYLALKPAEYVRPLPTEGAATQSNGLSANLSLSPRPPKPGSLTQLSLTVSDANGNPAALLAHHGRLAHMMIVADDFSSFAHLHPEDFGTLCLTGEQSVAVQHSLQYRFPTSGRYLAAVNVATASESLNQSFSLRVPGRNAAATTGANTAPGNCFKGYPESSADQYSSPVLSKEAEVSCDAPNAYRIELELPESLRANEDLRLGYRISQYGQPVTNLQPYLAAGLHVAVLSTPIEKHGLQHIHGMPVNESGEIISANVVSPLAAAATTPAHHASADHHLPPPAAFGPRLLTEPFRFPERGRYWLFGQFRHNQNIVFSRFAVDVEAGFADDSATIVELELTGNRLTPATVKATQGQNLILRIKQSSTTEDAASDLHITGYEIEKSLASKTTELRFNANLAGQFSIELHPAGRPQTDIPLGLLQVLPR